LAIADKVSYDIFGTFIAITYLTPFLGGFLADKKLGYITSVYIGGVLMGLGYIGLGIPGLGAMGIELSEQFVMGSFWVSMFLIVVGNGFFKPSISTILGNLYSTPEFKEKKDWGYNLFYMGINIGALLGPIFAAFMRNKYNWSASFITAGVGMFIGLIVFTIGLKHIRPGERKTDDAAAAADSSLAQVLSYVFLPAIAAGLIGWFLPSALLGSTLMDSKSTDAFLFASIPVIIFYVSLWLRARESEKRPIAALLAIFAVSVVFWAVFKQNGTALTNWGKYYTDREVPAAVQGASRALYQAETMQTKVDSVNSFDEQFRAIKKNDKPLKTFDRHVYFRNLPPERIPQNGEPVYLISTELFQSINPLWVVLLTPLVIAAFAWMRKRKKEPTTPGKIALGLVISALSTLVMVGAVYASNNGAIKVSTLWLVGCYGVITVGELCLSPMGLSLVSKLSPPRFTALMMGGFFLSTSIGNKMSGVLAGMWYGYENKANFFLVNCLLLLAAGAAAFMLLKWLNKVMEEKGLR
jgi:POT family proton-dependent oligopeptide transporter